MAAGLKRYVIAIDGGTTNTRARLVDMDGPTVVAVGRVAVGARNTGTQGREGLEAGVAAVVESVLRKASVTPGEVREVVASGMITCEAGLLDVPHVLAPAGVAELARGTVRQRVPAVWPEPITFIPGVKCLGDAYRGGQPVPLEEIEDQDVMRGEEAETLGILHQLGLHGPVLLVLPGSHSKLLLVDGADRISASVTTVAGELASAVASSTLLARSLETGNLGELNGEAAAAGFDAARRNGLGRSLFLIRLLHLLAGTDVDERKSFLWGALVGTDVLALEADARLGPLARGEQGGVEMLVGGSDPLRTLFGTLLTRWAVDFPQVRVRILSSEVVEQASAVGAALVAVAASGGAREV